jgi:hypothetical protein
VWFSYCSLALPEKVRRMPLDARYAHWLQHPDDELIAPALDAPDDSSEGAQTMMQDWDTLRATMLDASEDD